MSDFPSPKRLLCLSCGTLLLPDAASDLSCHVCGHVQDRTALLHMYQYAAETYYYGHQYRLVYERSKPDPKEAPRFSLSFGGEALAWVMLAVLSGVIGNAAYDTVKLVVRRLQEQAREVETGSPDYLPLLELSDEQLGDLIDSATKYCNDLDGLTNHVRLAIIEELVVDTIGHNPALGSEMQKLMARTNIKPKQRKRFVELLRLAMAQRRERTRQAKAHYVNLWSNLPPHQ